MLLSKLKTDISIRYKIKSSVIIKVVFVIISIFIKSISSSIELTFVLNTVLIYIMILCEEQFWKNESMNFQLYKSIGVMYKHYINIKILGSFMFNSFVFILLTLFMTKNVILFLITVFLALFLTIYWNVVFTYIFYLAPGYDYPLRSLVIVGFIIAMFIPVVSIIVLIIFNYRNILLWNGDNKYVEN